MTQGIEVAVIGAGVGGAAAALLLARTGARVTLLERVPEPKAVGAGIMLQPNGLAVLYGLGLRDALHRRAWVSRRVDLADGTGRVLLSSTVPDFGAGYDHVLVLRRSHLLEVLLDAVAAQPRVTIRLGCEVVGAAPDGTIAWRGADGDASMRAELVVGADGLRSTVREGGRFGTVVTAGPSYLRALVSPQPLAVMTEYWTALGIFGAGPVDDGLYFYASTAAPALSNALERRDLGALQRAWQEACPVAGAAFARVERFDDLLVTMVTRIDCARWHDGRLVLLGDAAHAMAPNVGQGANSALVDAAVLTDALGAAEVEGALGAYERRRRPRVRLVQDAAGMLGRLGEVRGRALRAARDNFVRLVLGRFGTDRSVRLGQQEDPPWLEAVAQRRLST